MSCLIPTFLLAQMPSLQGRVLSYGLTDGLAEIHIIGAHEIDAGMRQAHIQM